MSQDWRNAADYDYGTMPARSWGWEFLRRNERYRTEWAVAVGAHREAASPVRERAKARATAAAETSTAAPFPEAPLSIHQHTMALTLRISYQRHVRQHGSGDGYDLWRGLGTPRLPSGEWVALAGDSIPWGLEIWLNPDAPANCLVAEMFLWPKVEMQLFAINPTQPIEPQLETVRWQLAFYQKSHNLPASPPRIHAATWVNYLRLLDSRSAGASTAEILPVLYANELERVEAWDGHGRVRNDLARARKLVNGDYRRLLSYPGGEVSTQA